MVCSARFFHPTLFLDGLGSQTDSETFGGKDKVQHFSKSTNLGAGACNISDSLNFNHEQSHEKHFFR
jgi:uncharacterized protein YfiM (DUF2279 family)